MSSKWRRWKEHLHNCCWEKMCWLPHSTKKSSCSRKIATSSNRGIFAFRTSLRGRSCRFLISRRQCVSLRRSLKRSKSSMRWRSSRLRRRKPNYWRRISEWMRKWVNFNSRSRCWSSVMRDLCQGRARLWHHMCPSRSAIIAVTHSIEQARNWKA